MRYSRFIERGLPHTVDTVVPERGLRSKQRAAIFDFHARRGIKPYTKERYNDDCHYIRWLFADREIAEAFAAKFTKERRTLNGIEGIVLQKLAVESVD
jgi:hypothetical protein